MERVVLYCFHMSLRHHPSVPEVVFQDSTVVVVIFVGRACLLQLTVHQMLRRPGHFLRFPVDFRFLAWFFFNTDDSRHQHTYMTTRGRYMVAQTTSITKIVMLLVLRSKNDIARKPNSNP
jgi:hypothetical protein